MKDLAQNNLIKFQKISKSKEGVFAHFKAKGVKGGVTYSATINVDISDAEVDTGDSLEKIIEESAKRAVKEFKRAELQFEGLASI